MTIEKKTIRSDIPGHHSYLSGGYYGHDDMRRMVVGRGIHVQGAVADCDHLVVEGSVEAEDFAARRMDLSEPGLFTGKARVSDAIIAGRFEGTLTVTGRLVLRGTARVTGDISYGTLEIEAGAALDGRIAPIRAAEQEKPASVVLLAPAVAPTNVENLFEPEEEDDAEDDDAEEIVKERGGVYRRAVGFK